MVLPTQSADPSYVDLCPFTSRKHCRQQSQADVRRMDTCRYLHWMVEDPLAFPTPAQPSTKDDALTQSQAGSSSVKTFPPQWVNCDLRHLDVGILGKFNVLMMDPPWDIHMSLPYGTMTDDEMLKMPVPSLQESGGLIFVGYERIEEIVWVKTNQLQRLIRTGRTGHYLNHSKEHCLVGFKRPADKVGEGSMTKEEIREALSWVKSGIDTDVIVAEVRETSRKPDEIYEMIERACPGGRKLELFGRSYNFRPGWYPERQIKQAILPPP
ncbi:hypothetical protein PSTT_13954 [Puccinia striiformis]|uniref:mRNA m(6)A methyltransferase n=1 Tax=Puccinia striiformis TaxID=27350 RepID=A0A2S4UPH4_9BASI|nr:hypothetical protein PSTT_13954 [Puccinia striiformis]